MAKGVSVSGLWTRMVRLVHKPSGGRPALEEAESDLAPPAVGDEQKEALDRRFLQDLIERKRRNDVLRKRELDMLRALRQRDILRAGDTDAAPSAFVNSQLSSPLERASTLKKIDAIEEEMSLQWWSSSASQASPSPLVPLKRVAPQAEPEEPRAGSMAFVNTASVPVRGLHAPLVDGRLSPDFDPTHPADRVLSPVPGQPVAAPSFVRLFASAGEAVDVKAALPEQAQDVELEQAAIRFATGDTAGAERGLLEALGLATSSGSIGSGSPVASSGLRRRDLQVWLHLFDLYRATGQKSRFNEAVPTFNSQFGRAAPSWFCFHDISTPSVAAALWVSPTILDVGAVESLVKATQDSTSSPWVLDWNGLESIELPAATALLTLLDSWVDGLVPLTLQGLRRLDDVLERATPFGKTDTPKVWWDLRFDFFRLLHRAEDFERVALDFCLTYDLPPPVLRRTVTMAPVSVGAGAGPGAVERAFADSSTGQGESGFAFELVGEMTADSPGLMALLSHTQAGEVLVISCARLIRMDFAAAGVLLNWVARQKLAGCSICFVDAHRLMAGFFGVVGISLHAQVDTRAD